MYDCKSTEDGEKVIKLYEKHKDVRDLLRERQAASKRGRTPGATQPSIIVSLTAATAVLKRVFGEDDPENFQACRIFRSNANFVSFMFHVAQFHLTKVSTRISFFFDKFLL
jgi:hypothetical protein